MAIKSLFKYWICWIFGVLIAVFIKSLWENREVDWGNFVTLSIGGLVGLAIGLGIKKLKNC
ncbi:MULTISPECIES: hypothetical protein [Lysinibacillus]|uniref:hypothetical protein n=1 Tax=Lysinibacillus TaxID=400634 RepID=UPI001CBAB4E1|nr:MULTISPECIES: hypothetical protein [Lysinibacillus]MDM5249032.1 hypothetical protein [Lysinibacillus sp. G4S2]